MELTVWRGYKWRCLYKAVPHVFMVNLNFCHTYITGLLYKPAYIRQLVINEIHMIRSLCKVMALPYSQVPTTGPYLSHMDSNYNFAPCTSDVHFNIMTLSTSRPSKWSLPIPVPSIVQCAILWWLNDTPCSMWHPVLTINLTYTLIILLLLI